MATSTRFADAADTLGADDGATDGGGFWHRAFQRMVAAREAKARSIAYQHLARLSEERLVGLGFEANEIRKIRSHSGDPLAYWD
jgi:hypothetical protein